MLTTIFTAAALDINAEDAFDGLRPVEGGIGPDELLVKDILNRMYSICLGSSEPDQPPQGPDLEKT
jgi:hypothetical protein